MARSFVKISMLIVIAGLFIISASVVFADMLYLRSGHDVIMQSVTLNGDVYNMVDCDGESRTVDADFVLHIKEDIGCDYKTDSQVEFENEYRIVEQYIGE